MQSFYISYKKYILFVVLVNIVVALPLISNSSYGVTSLGSKLEYLNDNRIFKHLTYINVILFNYLSVLIAKEINSQRKITLPIFISFILVFMFSLFSGSKGMFFLFLMQVLAVINYDRYKISFRRKILWGIIVLILLAFSIVFISSYLSISYKQFIELAFNRFFLTNDARALAFDYRYINFHQNDVSFIRESFRSLSSIFGYQPVNPPLGNYLFSLSRGILSDDGANASLGALAVFYSPENYVAFNIILVLFIPVLLVIFVMIMLSVDKYAPRRLFLLSGVILCLTQISQDFLAAQLVILSYVSIYVFWALAGIIISLPEGRKRINGNSNNCNTNI
ncbi:hypothetical protein [Photorhabdus akhurstii]|uniref:hypothetical protein n=1 Tax=Photorhabdus akhurstii TaxID=171438 RepID=UPI0037047A8B